MQDEETKCCLCGKKESQDTESYFIRECYMMGQGTDDRPIWDKGLMQPRLNFVELGMIHQRGSNYLCHNRTRCRDRQAKNSRDRRKEQLRRLEEQK